jgi:ABC-type branched-subunit amino acid transport system substrate-binding protein
MSRSIRTILGGAACAAVAALAVAGCGSSSSSSSSGGGGAPGVTKTSITIGSHQPLTGPAAAGYSEIAPASNAYFQYVNANGGVDGRKIHYIYKDDAYNPTQTVSVVKQLVLQDKVFAIFNGLGTPTHTKVVGYLNASHVPDLFVASGCPCWDGSAQPETFGWQPNYTIEGKLLGQYIKQHLAGKKVGVLYQDDDFGKGGLAGIQMELPKSQIVSAQPYEAVPSDTNLAPQITALKGAGAQIEVNFTIPAYTALSQLAAFTLGYKPQLMVSNVGDDPLTVGGLLKAFSKGKASTALIEGAISDYYLPSPSDTSNSWIKLFKKIHDRYDASAPFDQNVTYGMAVAYTLVQALKAAGQDLTRQAVVNAVEHSHFTGPGLVPFRFSPTQHGGYAGGAIGVIKNGKLVITGAPETTDPTASSPITPYTGGQPTAPANGLPQ